MYTFTLFCYAFSILNLLGFALILWAGKHRGIANKVFGVYFFLFSIPLLFNLAVLLRLLDTRYYYLYLLPTFLIGPTIYFFSLIFSEQDEKNSIRKIIPHYRGSVMLFLLFGLMIEAIHSNLLDGSWPLFSGDGIPDSVKNIAVYYVCFYHYLSWRMIRQQMRSKAGEAVIESKRIVWLHGFLKTMLLICGLFVLAHSFNYILVGGYSAIGSSVISPLILSLSYVAVLRKSMEYIPVFSIASYTGERQPVVSLGKKNGTVLSGEQIAYIEKQLNVLFEKEKLFTDHELSLISLAQKIEISHKLLSQYINQQFGVNFNDFINAYRVDEAVRMMQDETRNNLKLEVIASESGFSSRASFFAIFKKMKGQTPAAFRKMIAGNGI